MSKCLFLSEWILRMALKGKKERKKKKTAENINIPAALTDPKF